MSDSFVRWMVLNDSLGGWARTADRHYTNARFWFGVYLETKDKFHMNMVIWEQQMGARASAAARRRLFDIIDRYSWEERQRDEFNLNSSGDEA